MNEGKSQTWFKYAHQIMEEYPDDIFYTMKLDADSILHLHEFFHFAYQHLPPPPYSDNAYVGSLRDKAYWPKKGNYTVSEMADKEGYFGTEFEVVLEEGRIILQNTTIEIVGNILSRKI